YGPMVNTPVVEQAQAIAELRQELEARNRDLAESLQREKATASDNVHLTQELEDCKRQLVEALEQQTATSEILGVIASSPTDIHAVIVGGREKRRVVRRGPKCGNLWF